MNEKDKSSGPYITSVGWVQELLARIERGDSNAAAEVYKLGQQEKYATIILGVLLTMTETKRQALYKVLANDTEEFRNTLIAVVKKESFDRIYRIIACCVIVLAGVKAIWNSWDSILLWILFAGFSFFGGMLIFIGAKKLKVANEAKESLS
jgi:hypothetical protein